MSGILSGVRVVELAQSIFVPSAGALLADLGADVIKVEHPRLGDPALLMRLVSSADVFLTSLRPGALERLSLGVGDLRAHNPKLIYARGHGVDVRRPERKRR